MLDAWREPLGRVSRAGEAAAGKGVHWEPILTDSIRAAALDAVLDIAAAIEKRLGEFEKLQPGDRLSELGVASDAAVYADTALLFAYLARTGQCSEARAKARRFASRAVVLASEARLRPGLLGGLLGVAWCVQHVVDVLAIEQPEDVNDETDLLVLEWLNEKPWVADFDLTSGLVGAGVYALERSGTPASVACVGRILSHLEALAHTTAVGAYWYSRTVRVQPELAATHGEFLMVPGVAHGTAGVIAFLARAAHAGLANSSAKRLLEAAVTGLLACRLRDGGPAVFPNWLAEGAPTGPARLSWSWCYGDPGIAASLMATARLCQRADWEEAALQVAAVVASRSLDPSTAIRDPNLCHGTVGIAHVLNRFYQATGDEQFRRAASFWMERTLQIRRPNEGFAGFVAMRGREKSAHVDWVREPSLLLGAVGVSLALLAAATPTEPEWDRLLMVGIPPRE